MSLFLTLLFACTPSSAPGTTPSTWSTGDTAAAHSALDTSGPTGGTGHTGLVSGDPWDDIQVDCGAIHPIPHTYEVLNFVASAEDFTFDPQGNMIAVQGGNLKATPYGGSPQVLVPNLGDARGTRMLSDGRLALALIASGTVILVDPSTGGRSVLASGLQNPNGIAIGTDDRVYVATSGKIMRLDPVTLATDVVAEIKGRSFDGLTFSPDYSRLYFNEELGRVHWVDLDAQGNPGPVQDGPSIPIGKFSLLDGMTADACGNLYVAEMGGVVWRVGVNGQVEVALDTKEPLSLIPALNFGSGQGGWARETLYVLDFKGKMYAADVGVRGKWEPHLPE